MVVGGGDSRARSLSERKVKNLLTFSSLIENTPLRSLWTHLPSLSLSSMEIHKPRGEDYDINKQTMTWGQMRCNFGDDDEAVCGFSFFSSSFSTIRYDSFIESEQQQQRTTTVTPDAQRGSYGKKR